MADFKRIKRKGVKPILKRDDKRIRENASKLIPKDLRRSDDKRVKQICDKLKKVLK